MGVARWLSTPGEGVSDGSKRERPADRLVNNLLGPGISATVRVKPDTLIGLVPGLSVKLAPLLHILLAFATKPTEVALRKEVLKSMSH